MRRNGGSDYISDTTKREITEVGRRETQRAITSQGSLHIKCHEGHVALELEQAFIFFGRYNFQVREQILLNDEK